MIAYAQEGVELAHSFVGQINQVILFPLITLLTVIALLYFLWGGFQYVANANNDSARAAGKKHLFWGIIGLLIMLSAYAILSIAANTFGIDADQYNRAPQYQQGGDGLDLIDPRSGQSGSSASAPAPSASIQPSSGSGRFDYVVNDLTTNGVSEDTSTMIVRRLESSGSVSARSMVNDLANNGSISSATRARILADIE